MNGEGRTIVRVLLQPADLSAQEGVYYKGTLPGCEQVCLWSYSHRTEPKNEAPRYWFLDARIPFDVKDPDLASFTGSEVTAFLEMV